MVIGSGSNDNILKKDQIHKICKEAFDTYNQDNKRVLFIIPDNTRTAPIDIMFKVVYELLSERVEILDFIIALGTHPPLSEKSIYKRVGITAAEHQKFYSKARFFNHNWKDLNQLKKIGTINKKLVSEISNGLMNEDVDITINKMVFDYDQLIIIGPTFPHEVVGYSGGNKYLFPGISGEEIINMFHWLGALITNPLIIGNKYTPVRKVIDLAAKMVQVEKLCISLVVKGEDLVGLYIGTPEDAWESAADLSNKINIIYKEHQFHTVLSRAPEMYDDLWTGGKCMYKLEPIVADGGNLIIYAPHIRDVSLTHGETIEKIGYHVRDYFNKQLIKFQDIPGGILAHSTHVKGVGTFVNGIEKPRINVILATGINKETCEKINLGYMDYNNIKLHDFINKEDKGFLYVPKAGEMLYRLKNKD